MRIRSLALVVALVALIVPLSARQGEVTLEALLAPPFPSEIAASRAGAHVAWVQNVRGSRNVWIATAPDFKGRQVTSYAGDDGQDIAGLTWAPDGNTLLYVRGGGPNRAGDIPNPANLADAAEQAIWSVAVTDGVSKKLAAGSAPAVSRTGQVAYIVRGQVWSTSADGAEKPGQLFSARGGAGNLQWSDDGRRLAFVSGRGDHSFIGVFDTRDRVLRYLDPSVDVDGNPVWSPDGSRLAFTRTPFTRETLLFAPRREGEPWSIRIADVATGRSSEVWKADPGAGSVFQGINAETQMFWAGDRIVFPWEKTGWLNLYTMPAAGGRASALVSGAFEVEHVALAPDRSRVIYSSNQNDIERRHIWSVPVAGGAPAAVTSGRGIEWMPAPVSDGAIAFLGSTARQPARAMVMAAPEKGSGLFNVSAYAETSNRPDPFVEEPRPLVPDSPSFPAAQLVEPQPVSFPAADGMTIRGQLFMPRDLKAGEKRPAVLFFHGGSRRQMLLGWHYLSYYHNTYALNQYLASRGYIVLAVNYRSGTGYGLNFREALNYGATGASEFNDVLGAGLYMKSRPEVDQERIGLWGGSYGGFLTAHGLARASDLFAAGVDIHGVHDWNVGIRTFIPSYAPSPEIERRNFQSSPLAYVSGWRSPVLLIHGDDDRNVSFSETVTLAAALRKQGVTFEQLIFPDEVHGFLRHASWLTAFGAASDFLDRHLKNKRGGTAQ